MKRIIVAMTLVIIALGMASLSHDTGDFHIGRPAFALCTTAGIKNDCCFKFFKVLEGAATDENVRTREKKAIAEFKRCMRADIGCSVEMTEMKSKSVRQIRTLCE